MIVKSMNTHRQTLSFSFWQVLGSEANEKREARTEAGKAEDKDTVRTKEKGKRMNWQEVRAA